MFSTQTIGKEMFVISRRYLESTESPILKLGLGVDKKIFSTASSIIELGCLNYFNQETPFAMIL